MDMWDGVKAGEIRYIYPYQEEANVIFNTSLYYEIPLLKKYAYDMLSKVTEDNQYYSRARRLMHFMDYFIESDEESEIPPISILREFIGNCTFYDK